MLVPPLFVVFSALFLNAAILLRPVTYDRFLYAFDGSLGSSPDSGRRKLLMHNYWLGMVCNAACFSASARIDAWVSRGKEKIAELRTAAPNGCSC